MTMTEREAAIDWLENLSPSERREHFLPAIVSLAGYEGADRIGSFATLKDDHEGDLEFCVACKDPNAIVVA